MERNPSRKFGVIKSSFTLVSAYEGANLQCYKLNFNTKGEHCQ